MEMFVGVEYLRGVVTGNEINVRKDRIAKSEIRDTASHDEKFKNYKRIVVE
jgi:hypothetical protein